MEDPLNVGVQALHIGLVHAEALGHHGAGLVDGHRVKLGVAGPVLIQEQQQLLHGQGRAGQGGGGGAGEGGGSGTKGGKGNGRGGEGSEVIEGGEEGSERAGGGRG